MSRSNFNDWIKTFRESINGYDYYIDCKKILRNAAKLEVELHILNVLIGAQDIEAKFQDIITRYPECLKAIPILLAVRKHEIYCQDINGAFTYRFDTPNQTLEQYTYFMRETGIFDILREKKIASLYGYVMGVEAGLDSNGRKNRGGHQMENLVESYLIKAGVNYRKEITTSELQQEWGVNFSSPAAQNKRWDFAVRTDNCVYVIETNFYTSGGSKLNETARSYKLIAEEAKNINDIVFVWITDGKGWLSAKHNLQETFNILKTLYNITDLEHGIFSSLFTA
ncbi:MAG: type II restriction endonuclease [Synergistaceae bacterium]|nr:type II restriction endonuclease [Synergistaceae bacterium]